jgi:4-phytase/acid phosphatase
LPNTRWKALFLSCIASLCLGWSAAQAQRAAAANGHPEGRLRMVVILNRHGVRSPTWTQARLDSYSAQPWPKWSVAPGNLTAHGYELMKRFGSFDRASFAAAGLLAANGCADAAKIYMWADTDQRTMESGRALSDGLFPTCLPPVHSLGPSLGSDQSDPLFHPAKSAAKLAETAPAADAQPSVDPDEATLIAQMQRVLMGCAPEASCIPTHPPAVLLLKTAGNEDKKKQHSHRHRASPRTFCWSTLTACRWTRWVGAT